MGLFTRLCEAPATSLHPTNEPGPQLGRHIPCFRQAAISQAAKTSVVLEHSCGWSFPAITPFGWEAPVSIHLGRGFLCRPCVAPLCGVRRSVALSQAVATGRRAAQAAGTQRLTISLDEILVLPRWAGRAPEVGLPPPPVAPLASPVLRLVKLDSMTHWSPPAAAAPHVFLEEFGGARHSTPHQCARPFPNSPVGSENVNTSELAGRVSSALHEGACLALPEPFNAVPPIVSLPPYRYEAHVRHRNGFTRATRNLRATLIAYARIIR